MVIMFSENPELPRRMQNHLHSLFEQIETEFSLIYAENMELKKNVAELNEKLNSLDNQLSTDKGEANHSNGTDNHKVIIKKNCVFYDL